MSQKYTLEELYQKGVISYKPIVYREIKQKVQQLILTGVTRGQAVKMTAKNMGWTIQGIYQALRKAP